MRKQGSGSLSIHFQVFYPSLPWIKEYFENRPLQGLSAINSLRALKSTIQKNNNHSEKPSKSYTSKQSQKILFSLPKIPIFPLAKQSQKQRITRKTPEKTQSQKHKYKKPLKKQCAQSYTPAYSPGYSPILSRLHSRTEYRKTASKHSRPHCNTLAALRPGKIPVKQNP